MGSKHFKVIVTILRFDIAAAEHCVLLSITACIACYQARCETDPYILTSDTHTNTHTHTHTHTHTRITTFRSTTDRIYDAGPIRLQYYNTSHCVTIAYSIQYSNMLYRFVA